MTTGPSKTQLARALHITPRTRRYVLRDSDGIAYDGGRTTHVLAALCRTDITPDLPTRVHTVAWAVLKAYNSGRLHPGHANQLTCATPYAVAAFVAAVARECPETTIGGICDGWLPGNAGRLAADHLPALS